MPERVCDACGKKKDISGGKICEKGHFVCSACVYGGLFGGGCGDHCPICKTKLR